MCGAVSSNPPSVREGKKEHASDAQLIVNIRTGCQSVKRSVRIDSLTCSPFFVCLVVCATCLCSHRFIRALSWPEELHLLNETLDLAVAAPALPDSETSAAFGKLPLS